MSQTASTLRAWFYPQFPAFLSGIKSKYKCRPYTNRHKEFTGHNACGIFSQNIAHLIHDKFPHYHIKTLYWKDGVGPEKRDHVSLFVDHHVIVDATYRQMLDISCHPKDSAYYQALYNKHSVFIGTRKDMQHRIHTIIQHDPEVSPQFHQLMDIWNDLHEPPYHL